MFKKIESLKKIKERGLNTHRFVLPNSKDEFIGVLNSLEHCTIRTDHKDKTEQLPFYVYNNDNIETIEKIWGEIEKEEYKTIVSDGIKYDNIQEYNIVTKIQKNGDFIFEASALKIPLRNMYKYDMTLCIGNICEELTEWNRIKTVLGLDLTRIRRDLNEIYSFGIYDRWLEITKYPINVGEQEKKFVFWQVI